MNGKIGIIIPAFNEAPRIGEVLDTVSTCRFFSSRIVVDDGSRDETSSVAGKYPLEVMKHPRNLGKGAALQTGLNAMKEEDIVVFLDGDLRGVTEDHLRSLIEPLASNPATGMTVAQFINGRNVVDIQQKYCAILNGQRALSRGFIKSLPELSWTRFGVEVLITRLARDLRLDFKTVTWPKVTHYLKEEKFGSLMGFYARLKMYKEAVSTYLKYPGRISRHLDAIEMRNHKEYGDVKAD